MRSHLLKKNPHHQKRFHDQNNVSEETNPSLAINPKIEQHPTYVCSVDSDSDGEAPNLNLENAAQSEDYQTPDEQSNELNYGDHHLNQPLAPLNITNGADDINLLKLAPLTIHKTVLNVPRPQTALMMLAQSATEKLAFQLNERTPIQQHSPILAQTLTRTNDKQCKQEIADCNTSSCLQYPHQIDIGVNSEELNISENASAVENKVREPVDLTSLKLDEDKIDNNCSKHATNEDDAGRILDHCSYDEEIEIVDDQPMNLNVNETTEDGSSNTASDNNNDEQFSMNTNNSLHINIPEISTYKPLVNNPLSLLSMLQHITVIKSQNNSSGAQTEQVEINEPADREPTSEHPLEDHEDTAGNQDELVNKLNEFNKALGQNVNTNVRNQLLQQVFLNQLKQQHHKLQQNEMLQKLSDYQALQSRKDKSSTQQIAEYLHSLQEALAARLRGSATEQSDDNIKTENSLEMDEDNRLNYGNLTIYPIKCKPKIELMGNTNQPMDLSNHANNNRDEHELDTCQFDVELHHSVKKNEDDYTKNSHESMVNNFQQNLLQILANQSEVLSSIAQSQMPEIKTEELRNNPTDVSDTAGSQFGLHLLANIIDRHKTGSSHYSLGAGLLNTANFTKPTNASNAAAVIQIIQKNLANIISKNALVPLSSKERVFAALVNQMLNRTNRSDEEDNSNQKDCDSFKQSNAEDSGGALGCSVLS